VDCVAFLEGGERRREFSKEKHFKMLSEKGRERRAEAKRY